MLFRSYLILFLPSNLYRSCKRVPSSSGSIPEISAISMIRPDQSDYFAKYVAIGLWEPHELHICKLNSLEFVGDPIFLKSFPRSMISQNFGTQRDPCVQLLVGQGDGTLTSFSLLKKGHLGARKVMHIGRSPLQLSMCLVHDHPAVLAAGDWSSVIYWEKDSLQQSSVPIKVRPIKSLVTKLKYYRMYVQLRIFIWLLRCILLCSPRLMLLQSVISRS